VLRVAPITEDGSLDLAAFRRLLSARTRLVAVAHASNVLGTVNPIRAIADLAHDAGAVLLVDGAQAVAHLPVDVQALDCDFFAFSGHKMLGPTGVGILYGRLPMLERMPPWQGGGGMIASVTFETTTYAPVPAKFEAGTPPITQAIGLGAAIEYLGRVDLGRIGAYEQALLQYATRRLQEVPGIRILGTAPEKVSVLSFVMDGVHPHDLGTVLDAEGIAIRAGHHCAQPLMRRLGVAATARASFAFYNTRDEVDRLVAGLLTAREVFG
jgi:cysteine desulfurase/selenocysteine lyase